MYVSDISLPVSMEMLQRVLTTTPYYLEWICAFLTPGDGLMTYTSLIDWIERGGLAVRLSEN